LINIPINGKFSEFGGILSVTSIRKTVIERRVVTPIETFSPNFQQKYMNKKNEIIVLYRYRMEHKNQEKQQL